MCLQVVTKRSPRQRAVKVAYKLVMFADGDVVVSAHRGLRLATSCWLKAKERAIGYGGNSYASGFHVFARQVDAKAREGPSKRVVEVKVRGVHTVGEQWEVEVWVAREMFVSVTSVRRALEAK